MHKSNVSTHGMAVAPTTSPVRARWRRREGGSAIEAMVVAAAAIAVVYPPYEWPRRRWLRLIAAPRETPSPHASGPPDRWRPSRPTPPDSGIFPHRGPQAALTVAGTVSGWDEALRISRPTGRAPPVGSRLLADAIGYAEDGIPVTASQAHATASNRRAAPSAGLQRNLAGRGRGPAARQPLPPASLLAGTPAHAGQRRSRQLLSRGRWLQRSRAGYGHAGMPVTLGDLQAHRAVRPGPLTPSTSRARCGILPHPRRGWCSLHPLASPTV